MSSGLDIKAKEFDSIPHGETRKKSGFLGILEQTTQAEFSFANMENEGIGSWLGGVVDFSFEMNYSADEAEMFVGWWVEFQVIGHEEGCFVGWSGYMGVTTSHANFSFQFLVSRSDSA